VAAERTLIEMDFSRRKRAGKIDSAAAAFILQGVLDRLRAIGSSSPGRPDAGG
jgi:putative Holliday junction resolvase